VRIAEGDSRLSGALYLAGADHCGLLSEAYAAFAHTNPMHTSVFPSVRRMEREVVAMTAALLGGARVLSPTAAAPLWTARPSNMPAGLVPATGAPAAVQPASLNRDAACPEPCGTGQAFAARRRQPPRTRRRRHRCRRRAHTGPTRAPQAAPRATRACAAR